MQEDYGNPGFETGKIWAIGWGVAAFLSLASGGMIGAIAFALLAFDSIAQGERDDDDLLPEAPNPFALPANATLFEKTTRAAATAPVNVQVPVDIHNHIAPSAGAKPIKTAAPAQSDRRTAAPDLSLYDDPKQRMQVLLKAMSQSGFPLGSLLNHPFVWCWGWSQSGKTTIALMLAIARQCMGHNVSYFTTDDDYPRSLPWSRVEDSPEGYAIALDDVAETISSASKGGLMGTGWVFDEMFAASAQHGITIQPLLTTVLMKGAKTRAGAIGISQADTSSAHGLKGIDAAWRDERVSIQALHEEDELGDRHPTGRYVVSRGDSSEEWVLPEWMLTQLNQWGSPDPVVWMVQAFPELCPVQPGSRPGLRMVQPGASGLAVNHGSTSVQPLNQAQGEAVQDLVQSGSRFMNQQFSAEEARAKVSELVQIGLNQTQIIQVLWGAKKGGNAAYQTAVQEYKTLMGVGENCDR
ncbi:MAG TPA: hypothetical protein V6C88_01740 [Chroococcidiopsis sp.]